MAEDNAQTQTQNSTIEWSQSNTPTIIPNIWGRIYSTKVSLLGKHCWKANEKQYPPYHDLIQPEFTLGRALSCTFVMTKDIIKEDIIKNVSKQHFVLKRDTTPMEMQTIIMVTKKIFPLKFITTNKRNKTVEFFHCTEILVDEKSPYEVEDYDEIAVPDVGGRLFEAFETSSFMFWNDHPVSGCPSEIKAMQVFTEYKLIESVKRETLSPAIITDLSYNGTFVNGVKVGKGNSRVLDDNDEIAVTHPLVKIFVFKDLLKNEQDKVPKEISQKYYISRTLGQGACGVVKLVVDKTKCTRYAMKIIKKSRLTNGRMNNLNDPAKILNEINIMKTLRHPCIISTEEVFDSHDTVFIILELMRGGELFERITKRGHLTEQLTRFMFRQMVLAVRYLHSQGITHRDLKPENVLLESSEEETLLKITDFGLSKFVGEDTFMRTMCGTPLYLAPEVLRANGIGCYGPQVDVWSLGVIFFICLVGYLPFSGDYKEMSLQQQILSGRFKFSPVHWKGVSVPARQLMKSMLTVQVAKRATLDEILQHPWMQDVQLITKVEQLLCSRMQLKKLDLASQSVTSTSDNRAEDDTDSSEHATLITVLAAKNKRALSDSFSSCEPIPKKLRIDDIAMHATLCEEQSESTSSLCSSG